MIGREFEAKCWAHMERLRRAVEEVAGWPARIICNGVFDGELDLVVKFVPLPTDADGGWAYGPITYDAEQVLAVMNRDAA